MIDIADFKPVAGSDHEWRHPTYGRCVGRPGQTLDTFVAELEAAVADLEKEGPSPDPTDDGVRLATIEAELAALRAALVKRAVLTAEAIDAEKAGHAEPRGAAMP